MSVANKNRFGTAKSAAKLIGKVTMFGKKSMLAPLGDASASLPKAEEAKDALPDIEEEEEEEEEEVEEEKGKLHVKVEKAKGLSNSDGFLTGTSDPYTAVTLLGSRRLEDLPGPSHLYRQRTKTVDNNLEPFWGENFTFSVVEWQLGES